MDLALSPDLEQQVARKVKDGVYQSADEVVREALELLEERDAWRAASVEGLRREVAVGLEQVAAGRVGPLDMEAVRAAAQERAAGRAES